MDEQTIERVTLLYGHTGPDTAYLVDDYPYGRALRCRIRYWIDTATRGAKAGQQRFVSQTTNPRRPGQPWNKPHAGTYRLRTWMYLDGQAHVQHTGISEHGIDPPHDARLRLIGIYDQLTDTDRAIYDQLLAASRRYPDPWNRWEDTVTFLARYLSTHGQPPPINNGIVLRNRRPFYIGDDTYPVAVAAARARLRH